MSAYTHHYRRELSPGITLEARTTVYCSEEEEGSFVEVSTLDAFTLTVFGKVTDLLPDPLKGTEEAWSNMGDMEGALWSLVDDKHRVNARSDWAKRRIEQGHKVTVVMPDNSQIEVAA